MSDTLAYQLIIWFMWVVGVFASWGYLQQRHAHQARASYLFFFSMFWFVWWPVIFAIMVRLLRKKAKSK